MNFLNSIARCTVIVLLLLPYTLMAQLSANFAASKQEACSPLVVQFTDQSAGNPTSWKWIFGNGNVSFQRNPGAVYLNPGTYDVTLVVSDGVATDSVTFIDYITVFSDPVANFTVNDAEGCSPHAVSFTNTSQPGSVGIKNQVWNFGDGTKSFDYSPGHTYTSQGIYNVTMLVIDSNGCRSEKFVKDMVTVADAPQVDFEASPLSACFPPLNTSFTNNSSGFGPLSYQWSFGDGTFSSVPEPSHTYTGYGSNDVKLIVSDTLGCTDSLTKAGYIVIDDLTADFTAGATEGCTPFTVNFTDASSPAPSQYLWDFGDGNTSGSKNPSHTYTSAGTYSVKLVVSTADGCQDSVIRQNMIVVDESPTADFTSDDPSACSFPHTVSFIDNSTGAISWFWDFGDGGTSTSQNPAHTYTATGSYTVSLTVMNTDSCTNTLSIPSYVEVIEPKADFITNRDRGCVPLEIFFSDQSTSGDSIVSWFWDFGDGGTSTSPNPVYTYNADGIYTVTLIIENASGCMDTLVAVDHIEAGDKPTADFSAGPASACLNTPVQFNNLSTGGNQHYWDFGDGNNSTDANPSYQYGDTGTFTITYIVTNKGCSDTLIKPDLITISPPVVLFEVYPNCDDPLEVIINDMSVGADSYLWEFGDGNTSTSPTPVHTYDSTGQYTIRLTASNTQSGCTQLLDVPVTVTDPQADFAGDTLTGCAPLTVNFSDSSRDANTYEWLIDGQTYTTADVSHTFNEPGTYDIRLAITDVNGCSDTIVKSNYVYVQGPIVDFSAMPPGGCAPLYVQFQDSSYSVGGNLLSWYWEFGDDSVSTLQHPDHIYETTGTYSVSLSVTDDNFCSATLTQADMVQPTYPNPAFVADTASCSGKDVAFTNTSVGTGLSYTWDFGDGTTSTSANPVHAYQNEGVYSVQLTVTDINGCDSTIIKPSYVTISDPIADFYADSSFSPCPPFIVNFKDTSIGNIASWDWDFGDGNVSTLEDPSNVYVTPGNFDVSLVVTSIYGCKDTMIKDDFTVILGPNGTFDFHPQQGCIDHNVTFEAVTTNTASRTWDFGDGSIMTAGDTTNHTYTNAGTYHPVLILDDGLGCVFSVPSEDSIVVGSIEADFRADTTYICKSGDVSFSDLSIGYPDVISWEWHFGDGNISTAQSPVHTYSTPGVYDVTLIVSNGLCYDTLTKPGLVSVDPGPQADFTMSVNEGCMPLPVQFTDATISDSTLAAWVWSLGNGDSSYTTNTATIYDTAGLYDVTLIVESIAGCSDEVTKQLPVYPLPVASAGPDTAFCYGESVQLSATGGISYSWSPSAGLNNSAMANPIASPANTTDYIVTVTDANKCTSTDTASITVYPLPPANAGSDIGICLGDSTQLTATGGIGYSWSPAVGLSCTNCSGPMAGPQSTTTYTVVVESSNGCFNTDDVTVTVNPLPEGIITPDTAICEGGFVNINAEGGTSYSWSPSAGLSSTTKEDPIARPVDTTEYFVEITNVYNCKITDSITIAVNPLPVPGLPGQVEVCLESSVILDVQEGSAFSWTPATGLSCDDCQSPEASPEITTKYEVEVTSAHGCVQRDSVIVIVNPLPVVNAGPDMKICKGEQFVMATQSSNAVSYQWNPAAGLSNATILQPTASPEQTTEYTLTATSKDNCTVTDAVLMEVLNKTKVEVKPQFDFCEGERTQLSTTVVDEGLEGIQYFWLPNEHVAGQGLPNPMVFPERTTEYTLIAYSGTCEPDTHKVNVYVHPLPEVDAGPDRIVAKGTEVNLQAISATHTELTYNWTPAENVECANCQNITSIIEDYTMFEVEVEDQHGCKSSDLVQIAVVDNCGEKVFVPNTFTPNGDESNDVLRVRGLGLKELKKFQVFNRWGQLMFETDNIDEGWDGRFKGKPLNPDVFVYFVEGTCTNDEVFQKKGNTMLMK